LAGAPVTFIISGWNGPLPPPLPPPPPPKASLFLILE